MLAQQQEYDKVYPIAFASRSLNAQERNYGIIKVETLLCGLLRYSDPIFLGHQCEVITDHVVCMSLLPQRSPSPKLTRRAMCIQELYLKIHHRLGKSNLVAGALSRHPLPVADVLQVVANTRVADAPENDIAKLQQQDDNLAAISSDSKEEACHQTLFKLST